MEGSEIKGLEGGCDSYYSLPPPPPTRDQASPGSAFGDAALSSPRPVSLSLASLGRDRCASGAPFGALRPRALRLASPSPREEALAPGSASDPSQPASRSPHSQSPAWRRRHTQAHSEEGSLILSHWCLGPERKIVWVNSQASRLNARLPPPPPPPSASPTPLPPHPPPTLRSTAGPRASYARRAGSPGLPGSKGPGPEGMPFSLCPGGQKRTAGRCDRPRATVGTAKPPASLNRAGPAGGRRGVRSPEGPFRQDRAEAEPRAQAGPGLPRRVP